MTGIAASALALGGAALAARQLARRALPRPGIVRVAGLDDEIEILRDSWGVPHIYARTEHDLFFANGVVHAEDRLWQMELNRRAARGRLSEVFGPLTLELDRFMRRIGLGRVAEAEEALLDRETSAVLDAYIAGINWVIEARPLPIEFTIARHTPEPWRRVDSLAWIKLMSWGLSGNWDAEVARVRLGHRLGPELAAELDPMYPVGGPLGVGGTALDRASAQLLDGYRQIQEMTGLGRLGGSNGWAVAPHRSASGAALLANDMHLAPQMPSVWYELSLDASDPAGEGMRVAGTSLPGLPGVVVGHNGHIAWGATASLADVEDLFVERVAPDQPNRFARDDGWEDARTIREEIRIKGRARWHVEEVLVSSNGPVITPMLDGAETAISLRCSILEPSRTLAAGLALNRARDWQEFRLALAGWSSPTLSLVYADRTGNIGMQVVGWVPRRDAGDGAVPAPGWDSRFGWQGYLTLDQLPHVLNPPDGIVATANNRPVGADYPFAIGCDWCDAYRIGRIVELLRASPAHSRETFAAIQTDVRTNAGRDFVARCRVLLAGEEPLEPLEREALRLLLAWDGQLAVDSVGGAIYEHHRSRLLRFLYAPALGDLVEIYLGAAPHRYTGLSSFAWRASSFLMRALDDPAFPDRVGHRGLSWRDILLITLGEAVSELRLRFGDEIGDWRWGRIHRLRFEHPLGRVKLLRRLFNRGDIEVGGDTDTPLQNGTPAARDEGNPAWIPSYRQIVDFGDLGRSVSIHTTGQSGQPGSRHYDDMIELWRRGDYHPMLWERADVETHLEQETRMLPTDELWPRP